MRTAYIDAFSGVSGDMLVGALLDAGASEARLRDVLSSLPTGPIGFTVRRETRGAFVGTRFLVEAREEHAHRRLGDIVEILRGARLTEPARANAIAVFTRLAKAESDAHGISPDEVHFHEVGALDTIADVVGACVAFEDLGIEQVAASPLELGSGYVRCDHGRIPVPAPGTIGALAGIPVRLGGLDGERTTPTGAALVATFARSVGEPVELTPSRIGYGVGSRETTDVANLLRVVVGEAARIGDRVVVLETNLDDTTGETVAFVIERLLAAGALDALAAPVVMKKGRPGFVLTVLAPPERSLLLEEVILRETPALGVRRHFAERSKLRRDVKSVLTPYGEARVKVRWFSEDAFDVSAEFEDARRIALERSLPLTEVVEKIEAAARQGLAPTQSKAQPHDHAHPHSRPHSQSHSQSHSHSHPHAHPHSHPHTHPHGHAHED